MRKKIIIFIVLALILTTIFLTIADYFSTNSTINEINNSEGKIKRIDLEMTSAGNLETSNLKKYQISDSFQLNRIDSLLKLNNDIVLKGPPHSSQSIYIHIYKNEKEITIRAFNSMFGSGWVIEVGNKYFKDDSLVTYLQFVAKMK